MMIYQLNQLTHLTPNEQVLVTYMLQYPIKVINFTPKELSAASFVSTATIYRLLTKLKVSGFNEFKIALAASIKQSDGVEQINTNFPIMATSTTADIVEQMTLLYQRTLNQTNQLINTTKIDSVVSKIVKAKMIDIYAAAGNIHFAKNFQFQLQEIGIMSTVPDEDYIQQLTAANSTEQHIAIVVSYGGRAQTTKEVIRLLNENQTPIILLTSTQGNPFVEFADDILYLASEENHYNKISSFSTRYSILVLFDLLFAGIFNQNPEKNYQYKLANYQKMNQELR